MMPAADGAGRIYPSAISILAAPPAQPLDPPRATVRAVPAMRMAPNSHHPPAVHRRCRCRRWRRSCRLAVGASAWHSDLVPRLRWLAGHHLVSLCPRLHQVAVLVTRPAVVAAVSSRVHRCIDRTVRCHAHRKVASPHVGHPHRTASMLRLGMVATTPTSLPGLPCTCLEVQAPAAAQMAPADRRPVMRRRSLVPPALVATVGRLRVHHRRPPHPQPRGVLRRRHAGAPPVSSL